MLSWKNDLIMASFWFWQILRKDYQTTNVTTIILIWESTSYQAIDSISL